MSLMEEAPVSVATGSMDLDTHFWQPLEIWHGFIDREHEQAVVAFHEDIDPLGAKNSGSGCLRTGMCT